MRVVRTRLVCDNAFIKMVTIAAIDLAYETDRVATLFHGQTNGHIQELIRTVVVTNLPQRQSFDAIPGIDEIRNSEES